ncbi:MAG: hypothetical protein C0498_09715 [Anaerolinea sp.]|nr:hypothetical protein [Anaerolinea sp.]
MSRRPEPDVPGDPADPPARPVPAATVVLLRPGPAGLEALLTRRPPTMAFGPDIHVFPGGRVDPADADPAMLATAGLTVEAAAANLGLGLAPDGWLTPTGALALHIAAVRETAEETGIEIDVRDLIALTRWVTPISLARRFDVRFFAVFVPPGTEVLTGSDEVAETSWLTPSAALAAVVRGRIELWQPTFVTLQQLEPLGDASAVRAAFAPGVGTGAPVIERRRADLARVDAAWAAGIPGRRATGWLLGTREIVVVDPADPTGVTTDAIRAEVAATRGRLAGVVVTALVPERHAGVEMFAHGLGLPVVAPAGTVAGAPYPVVELASTDRLPFGDPGITLANALALG